MRLFKKRPFLESFSGELRQAVVSRLGDDLARFISLSEQYRLDKNYDHFKNEEVSFAIGNFAITLTSFANAMGERRNFKLAREAVELALKLNPNHLAAYQTLALTHYSEDNKQEALRCCDKAKEIYDKIAVTPKNELNAHDFGAVSCGIDDILQQLREKISNEID